MDEKAFELIRRIDALRAWDADGHTFQEKLREVSAVEPCKDAISREYALGVIYSSNIYPSRADIYKALKDAPSVTVETDIDDYMKGYDHGTADTWKIAQTVFQSDVTLREAMDVAKCMKGAEDETY